MVLYIHKNMYSRLSLSQPRLSRITDHLEVKIWSLVKHENLTTGNKILWKREEIATLFHNIFNISLISGVKFNSHLWNVVVRFIFSSILQIWYVEVDISKYFRKSLRLWDNESWLYTGHFWWVPTTRFYGAIRKVFQELSPNIPP